MALPNMSGTARLYEDVELRFGANGTPVAKIPLVFNSRRKNRDTGEWEDGDSCFISGTVFKDRAEWAAEKLNRGDEVIVSGRLKTRSWEQDGQKRSMTELMIDEVGPTLRTLMPKAQRQGSGQSQGGFGQQGPQGSGGQGDDPWATGGGGGFSDDSAPPF